MEKQLLAAALLSRNSFALIQERLSPEAKTKRDSRYTPEFRIILNMVGDYYEKDGEAISVNRELLEELIDAGVPNDKHKERFKNLVAEALSADVSLPNINSLILTAKRHEIGDRLAMKLVNREDVSAELEEYNKTMLAEGMEDDGAEGVFRASSLAEALKEVLAGERGLGLYPPALNEAIGPRGLQEGSHVVVFGRPECFDERTELLTTQGWKSVKDVTTADYVAAVNSSREVVWEQPAATVERDGWDTLYSISNKKKQIDLLVTPDHAMVIDKGKGLTRVPAKEVKYYQGVKTHTAALATGSRAWSPEDAVAVAWQADGSSSVYKAHGYSGFHYVYTVSVLLDRKVRRLRDLLEASRYEYTETHPKNGYTTFRIKANEEWDKGYDFLDVSDLSLEFCRQFSAELAEWDGSKRSSTRWKYSNGNKTAVDKAQAIACMAGYNTFLSVVKNRDNYKDTYELHIRSNYTPIDGQNVIKSEVAVEIDKKMWCVSVSTGMLLVRRNGVVSVQGNSAKSAFAITNTARWAMQGKKVLYFINEDPEVNIHLRILCCITGMQEEDVLADVDKAVELAMTRGFGNIVIKGLTPGSTPELNKWIEEEKPDAIIVDQLRNLWAKADSRTNQLDQVARDVRDLGKKHGIVVLSVSQAGESAEGKAILGMADIDSSKTGIPASADVLIGIGATQEHVATGYRVLTLCKNKVNGNHASLTVRFNPQISRYTNV